VTPCGPEAMAVHCGLCLTWCHPVLCGAAGVVLMPCFLFWLWPPIVRDTPEGPATAAARLQEMGPLSTDEKFMMGSVTLAVVLWVRSLLQYACRLSYHRGP
jgi:di/tricarboxylate transporter